jgi:hypothetical protein
MLVKTTQHKRIDAPALMPRHVAKPYDEFLI